MQLCNPQIRVRRDLVMDTTRHSFSSVFHVEVVFYVSSNILHTFTKDVIQVISHPQPGTERIKIFRLLGECFLFEVDNDISGRCKENIPDKTAAHFRKPPEKEQLEIGRVKTSQSDQFLP